MLYEQTESNTEGVNFKATRGVSLEICELVDPRIVTCGIAVTEDDMWSRRNLVAERYLREGYILPTDPYLRNGAYSDPWESASVPLIAKRGPEVVSSLRLIRNGPELGLPINQREGGDRKFVIGEEYDQVVAMAPFEVSQLAKPYSPRSNADVKATLAVIRGFFAVMEKEEKDYAVAVVDSGVVDLLNGDYMHFGLVKVGEPKHYMGSDSTPVYINRFDVVNNSRRSRNPYLADFLEGKPNVEGFDWYKGV